MNVTNNNNEHLRYLVDTVGGGNVAYFASRHHVSTKESWTDDELNAASRRFSNDVEARDIYLEDFLNYRHELTRRGIKQSKNSNQFTFAIQSFNPNIVIGGGNTPQVRGYDANIFQTIANIFENQKIGLNSLNESFGGRFISEEDFQIRLHILHQQFDEAINSLADIFANFASELGLNASQARSNMLQIGNIIKDHIWSGGSVENIRETLHQNGATAMLNELDNLGNRWHGRFSWF